MEFGVKLPGQYPVTEPATRRSDEYIEMAETSRALGFTSAWIGQHFLGEPFRFLQPIPFLGRLAAVPEIQLGTTLLLPLYNPVLLAEELATLDVVSGGRVLPCFTLGYRELEFSAMGVPMRERRSRMEEAVQIMRLLWSGERFTFRGKHFQLEDIHLTNKPVQDPHPPILMGGNNPQAARRGGRLGDGWLVSLRSTLPTIRETVEIFREEHDKRGTGRRPRLYLWREVSIAETEAQAWSQAERYIGEKYATVAAWGHSKQLPAADSVDLPFRELAKGRFVIGSPAQCIAELERYEELLQPDGMVVRVQWPGLPQEQALESLRLFAATVIPHFAAKRERAPRP